MLLMFPLACFLWVGFVWIIRLVWALRMIDQYARKYQSFWNLSDDDTDRLAVKVIIICSSVWWKENVGADAKKWCVVYSMLSTYSQTESSDVWQFCWLSKHAIWTSAFCNFKLYPTVVYELNYNLMYHITWWKIFLIVIIIIIIHILLNK